MVKNIDKQLDDLWSVLVKKIAGYRCEYCGLDRHLTSHHIFSRSSKSVRWDLENGLCLCAEHHTISRNSAHGSPKKFKEWLKNYKGEEWYDSLSFEAKRPYKINKEERLASFKDKLGTYETP